MLKTSQSFDFSLGLQSNFSPYRNNKSSNTIQTAPSLQYSNVTDNSILLRGISSKDLNRQFLTPKLQRMQQSIVDIQTTPREVSENRLYQLQKLQKWVGQAFNAYNQQLILSRHNQQKIHRLQHKNKLLTGQIAHVKSMYNYFLQKYKKIKTQIKKKNSYTQLKIKDQIKSSRQRIQELYSQIQDLKQQIREQKAYQKQYEKRKFNQQHQFEKKPPIFQANPYPYNYPYPYGPYYNVPHPQYSSFHTFNNNNLGNSNINKQFYESQTHPVTQLKRLNSVDHSTPQFLTRRVSLQSDNLNGHSLSPQFIIQALTIHLGLNSNPQSNSHQKSQNTKQQVRSPSKMSGKWENTQQQKDVLNIMQSGKKIAQRKKLTLSQDFCLQGQNYCYSPTNVVHTPQFDLKMNKNLKQNSQSLTQIKQQYTSQKSNTSTPQKRESNKRMQQSKIKIQVDQSMSQMSKFSIQKRRKGEQSIKQSTIKIEYVQDDSKQGTGGQTSMEKDQANTSVQFRQKSPTMQIAKINSISNQNIQNMVQDVHSSQILSKRLLPPPRIPLEKKLRKVTQQQSDLFDSHGDPKMKDKNAIQRAKKQKKQAQITIFNIDQQNLKQSKAGSITMGKMKKQVDQNKQEQVQKKLTTQQDDDDDFMNINLLAVSKISKQKQLSQKAFNTISEDGGESSQILKKGHKSYNAKLDKSYKKIQKIIEQQIDFYDESITKREQQIKRCKKNSGSRFSVINQSNLQKSQQFKKQ